MPEPQAGQPAAPPPQQTWPAWSPSCSTLFNNVFAQMGDVTRELFAARAEQASTRAELSTVRADLADLRAEVLRLRADVGPRPADPRTRPGQ